MPSNRLFGLFVSDVIGLFVGFDTSLTTVSALFAATYEEKTGCKRCKCKRWGVDGTQRKKFSLKKS